MNNPYKQALNSKRNFRSILDYCKSNIDQVIPYFILLFVIILIGFLQPSALNPNWIANKIDSTMILIFVAVGQSFVMLVEGMDLSIAGVMSLTNCISALYMTDNIFTSVMIMLLCFGIGIGAGIINGLIVVKLNLQPFIATFATWTVYGGFALMILSSSGGAAPSWYMSALQYRFGGYVPVSVIIIAAIIVMWLFLKRTKFGISLFAVGSQAQSAYFNGINVNMVKIKAYAISGLFAAMAGVYRTGYVGSASPLSGEGYILVSFCAAVLGGINISGGRGGLIGTIVGAFLLKLISDLLLFAGLSTYWTSLFQGTLLITVVAINSISLIISNKRNAEETA